VGEEPWGRETSVLRVSTGDELLLRFVAVVILANDYKNKLQVKENLDGGSFVAKSSHRLGRVMGKSLKCVFIHDVFTSAFRSVYLVTMWNCFCPFCGSGHCRALH